MKVGVIADTHIHSLDAGQRLAKLLMDGPFNDVEMILHAGDHVHPGLDTCFAPIKYYGVCGNMDRPDVHLPIRRIISVADKRIGMIHGWGAPDGLERRVLDNFADEDIDVLVYGHSHQPVCRTVGSLLLFNPGSPTDRRSAAFHTVGILHIDKEVTGEIIRLY